jgi:16S rRNA (guanine527-N7)-methyltransferase
MIGVPARIASASDFQTAFGVSRETLGRLETYADLLRRWQAKINLVSPGTLSEIWHRHFADSAQLYALGPSGAGTWVDLGSGAGFPGLVLAILAAERGETRHVLVESDTRKAAFLREVARSVSVAVDIVASRIESESTFARVASVSCVTARALAPLPRLLSYSAPYFASSTVGLFLKGREVEAEIAEAATAWSFDHQLISSVTSDEGRVLIVRDLVQRA